MLLHYTETKKKKNPENFILTKTNTQREVKFDS